jgi:hypothetical protein
MTLTGRAPDFVAIYIHITQSRMLELCKLVVAGFDLYSSGAQFGKFK